MTPNEIETALIPRMVEVMNTPNPLIQRLIDIENARPWWQKLWHRFKRPKYEAIYGTQFIIPLNHTEDEG